MKNLTTWSEYYLESDTVLVTVYDEGNAPIGQFGISGERFPSVSPEEMVEATRTNNDLRELFAAREREQQAKLDAFKKLFPWLYDS